MSDQGEMATVRCLVPLAVKRQLEDICTAQRKKQGLHFQQTMAACLVIGLRAVSQSGQISYLVLEQVSGS